MRSSLFSHHILPGHGGRDAGVGLGPAGRVGCALPILVCHLAPPAGHREGGVDPAVEVQGAPGDTIGDAADRVTDVLPGADQHHAHQHHHEGHAVMELEGEVVDGGRVPLLEVGLDGAHNPVHADKSAGDPGLESSGSGMFKKYLHKMAQVFFMQQTTL